MSDWRQGGDRADIDLTSAKYNSYSYYTHFTHTHTHSTPPSLQNVLHGATDLQLLTSKESRGSNHDARSVRAYVAASIAGFP
jgi:hypothetical protein